jgi:hypothetical protein
MIMIGAPVLFDIMLWAYAHNARTGFGRAEFDRPTIKGGRMAKIFVRNRRRVGKGAGLPRFAIVAVEGLDLKVYARHIRRKELETLAEAVGAEIIYLPGGSGQDENADRGEHRGGGGGGMGRKRRRHAGEG